MCKIKPYPPKNISPFGFKALLAPADPAVDTVDAPPVASGTIDLRAVLPPPAPTGGDPVTIAVGDVAQWLRKTATPPTIAAGTTLDQAIHTALNGSASPLEMKLSAWRQRLASGGLIIAEMYVDEYFFAAGTPLVGADKIVNTFDDRPSIVPSVQTVIVVGSYVDALDHHSEHPSGRYLVRSGFGRSWGNYGVAWVAQKVARYRFIRGFAVG